MRRVLIVGRDVVSAQDYRNALRERAQRYSEDHDCPQCSLPHESTSWARIPDSRRGYRAHETHHEDRGHPRRGYLPKGYFTPR